MLGGSAGQFAIGPMIEHGMGIHTIWIGFGVIILVVAVLLFLATPKEQSVPHAQDGGAGSVLTPYKIVFSNPQSYLCGIIAGLMFAPTTIGDMIWGVASFQKDLQFSYHNAVLVASMVPLGWVFGCPLLGWLSDRIGRRKPVIMGSATVMILAGLQLALKPLPIPPHVAMFIFGVASGAAMIPYSVIKEVNPDNAKGSATGGINFLVFAITAFLGPVYAKHIGKGIGTATDLHLHFQKGAFFWIACCAAAIVVSFFLRETGPAAHGQVQAK
jgi:MFS family permease